MSVTRRALAIVVAVMAISTAFVRPATAQTPEVYGESSALALTLSIFGTEVGTGGSTEALGSSNSGTSSGEGLSIAAGSSSAADRATDERDPDSGENCASPALPAAIEPAVTAAAACSFASASIASGNPASRAEASIGELDVSGDLITFLVSLVLDQLEPVLQDALDAFEDGVESPLIDQLAAICADPIGFPLIFTEACDAIIELVVLVAPSGADDVLLALEGALTDALADVDLLNLAFGRSVSDVSTTAGELTSTASVSALSITTPSLDFLFDIVRGVLSDVVDTFLDDLEAALGPDVFAEVTFPSLADALDSLIALLPLDFLLSSQPLLSLELGESKAEAKYDRATGEIMVSGAVGLVVVSIEPTLAALLGIDEETTVTAGQDLALFEGTPLASTISVGSIEQFSDIRDGVDVGGVRATAVSIELLTEVEGGIVLVLSAAEAVAGGDLAATPRTGASSVLPGLALALLATAGMRFTRRRRLRTV